MLILTYLAELTGSMDQLSLPYLLFFFWSCRIRELIDDLSGHRGRVCTGRVAKTPVIGRMAQTDLDQAADGLTAARTLFRSPYAYGLGELGRQPDGDRLNVAFTRRPAQSLLVYTFLLPSHDICVH
jgi:hypothetical protein